MLVDVPSELDKAYLLGFGRIRISGRLKEIWSSYLLEDISLLDKRNSILQDEQR